MQQPCSTGQLPREVSEGEAIRMIERRVHIRVREIFEDAIECVRPFFDRGSLWSEVPLAHLAYRALRDRYPDLTFVESYVLVGAAARVYATECTKPSAAVHHPDSRTLGREF